MKIKQFNSETKGFFKAEENEKEAGLMSYTWAGSDKIIIDHTEVHPDFRGKNVGKQLLMEAVNFARQSKIKIIPLCPFAKSVFSKLQEIKDVL